MLVYFFRHTSQMDNKRDEFGYLEYNEAGKPVEADSLKVELKVIPKVDSTIDFDRMPRWEPLYLLTRAEMLKHQNALTPKGLSEVELLEACMTYHETQLDVLRERRNDLLSPTQTADSAETDVA